MNKITLNTTEPLLKVEDNTFYALKDAMHSVAWRNVYIFFTDSTNPENTPAAVFLPIDDIIHLTIENTNEN